MHRPITQRVLRRLALFNPGNDADGVFPGSSRYWEQRYGADGTSGRGSYGLIARLKARFVNQYIERHQIRSVIDFGAGDGNQLGLLRVPTYVGLDVSATAIDRLRRTFAGDATKRFVHCGDRSPVEDPSLRAEMGLSMDVLYHLTEQPVYERYLHDLFTCAARHVVIYSSNSDGRVSVSSHVRHRKFTTFVERAFPDWQRQPTARHPLRLFMTSEFHVFQRAVTPTRP